MEAYILNKTGIELDKMLSPSKINLYLPSPDTQVLTDADTWYKLDAVLTDGNARDFTQRGNPDYDILFTGINNSEILMIGDADMSLSGSSAELEFAVFINDVEAVKFTSKTVIVSSTEIESFGTNGLFTINNNQKIDIRAKCNAAGRTLTIQNLKVIFILNELL